MTRCRGVLDEAERWAGARSAGLQVLLKVWRRRDNMVIIVWKSSLGSRRGNTSPRKAIHASMRLSVGRSENLLSRKASST